MVDEGTTAIAVHEGNGSHAMQSLPPATSVEGLLLAAVQQGATVDQLERLMALRQQITAEQAKKEFDAAMSRFQADCPSIVKDKAVYDKYDKLRYRYAPLESVVRQTKDLIAANGLSYKLEAEVIKAQSVTEQSWVKSTCIVKHEGGHEEQSFFEVPVDMEAYMSAPQKFASALTFAKRYAFLDSFGIMTADDDTDAAEHTGGAQDFSEPAGGAADGLDPDFREGTGLYMLENVQFADNGKGLFAKFNLRAGRDSLTTSIFRGWEDACADVKVPTHAAQDKMRVAVNKQVEVKLDRNGKHLNITGIKLVEEAQSEQPAQQQKESPEEAKQEQVAPQPAPKLPAAPELQPPIVDRPTGAAAKFPFLTDSDYAGLLYQFRRVGGASWADAKKKLDENMLTNVKTRIKAGQLRIPVDQAHARHLPEEVAAGWMVSYYETKDHANWQEGLPFSLDDALRFVKGEWDPEVGDIGEAIDMDAASTTTG